MAPASEDVISLWEWMLEDEDGLKSGPALQKVRLPCGLS